MIGRWGWNRSRGSPSGLPETNRCFVPDLTGAFARRAAVTGSRRVALAVPDVEDVRRTLFVIAAVGAICRDEAMALVEPLRTCVGLERPQPQAARSFAFGQGQERYPMPRPVIVGST
jgi:hypothetical protein